MLHKGYTPARGKAPIGSRAGPVLPRDEPKSSSKADEVEEVEVIYRNMNENEMKVDNIEIKSS